MCWLCRAAIGELQGRTLMHKAYSKEMLPPMEGITSSGSGLGLDTGMGELHLSSDRGEGGGGGGGSRKGSKSEGIAFPPLSR